MRIKLDNFTRAYLECALWSSTDEKDRPLDDRFEVEDIAESALKSAREDCEAFQHREAEALKACGANDEQNGHDFWLTRNRHGAGFWDRGYPEPFASKLTEAAHVYGSVDLYAHRGKVYSN